MNRITVLVLLILTALLIPVGAKLAGYPVGGEPFGWWTAAVLLAASAALLAYWYVGRRGVRVRR